MFPDRGDVPPALASEEIRSGLGRLYGPILLMLPTVVPDHRPPRRGAAAQESTRLAVPLKVLAVEV